MRGTRVTAPALGYRGPRALTAASTGGAVLVGLIMTMAPIAAAHASVVVTAPYKKSSQVDSNAQSSYGCGKGQMTKIAHWTAKTGTGAMAERDAAKSCSGLFASFGGAGYSSGLFEIGVLLSVGRGVTSVSAQWTIASIAKEAINFSGTCPSVSVFTSTYYAYSDCSVYADVSQYGYMWVQDLTNGSNFYPSTYWSGNLNYSTISSDETCSYSYSVKCTYTNSSFGGTSGGWSGSTVVTWYMNGTYNSADSYALFGYIATYASATVSNASYPAQPGGSFAGKAASTLDMATLGNGATLNSIRIT